MKKLAISLFAAILFLTSVPMSSRAAAEFPPKRVAVISPSDSAEARILIARLDEIDKMDKSNLTASEKKELRKEVKATKKKLGTLGGGGLYISTGALIIIVVLLIILL